MYGTLPPKTYCTDSDIPWVNEKNHLKVLSSFVVINVPDLPQDEKLFPFQKIISENSPPKSNGTLKYLTLNHLLTILI